MNQTEKLGLPQWEDSDTVKREIINTAMTLLDEAVAKRLYIESWSYVGTGGYDYTNYMRYRFQKRPILMITIGPYPLQIGTPSRFLGFTRDSDKVVHMVSYAPIWDSNAYSFFSASSADAQANTAGATYLVFGICSD